MIADPEGSSFIVRTVEHRRYSDGAFVTHNPTSDIKPLHQQGRDRVLSEEELVEIWLAAGDREFGRIAKLLMLTGQRRQEIGGLEWAEVRLQRAIARIVGPRTTNDT